MYFSFSKTEVSVHFYDSVDTIPNNFLCPAQVGDREQFRLPELLQEMTS